MSTAPLLSVSPYLTELFVSDEVYFRLGSKVERLPACELAWMPGLEKTPAGCVVQAVRPHEVPSNPAQWIRRVESAVAGIGAPLCRIYLTSPAPRLEKELAAQGYRDRKELAFCASPQRLGTVSRVKFHPVSEPNHWEERLAIHREDRTNSDGYDTDPEAWCDLVRSKCATGIKESFLIEYNGGICGSIGAIQMRHLLRLKNIVIRPSYRRLGLGLEAVRELANLTHSRKLPALGVFGIEGENGARLYRSAGFSVIGYQTEWCKQIG